MNRFCFLLIIITVFICHTNNKVHAGNYIYEITTSEGIIYLNQAERYVLHAVAEGEVADLIEEFGKGDESRTIRSEFIRLLIIDKFPGIKFKKDIDIIGGVISGPLIIDSANVENNIGFINCNFRSYINLSNTQFKAYLRLSRSKFHGDVILNAIKVNDSLVLNNATFYRKIDLTGAYIGKDLSANSVTFKNKDIGISFNSIVVEKNASFRKAEFNGAVDFSKAKVGNDFVADYAKFKSKFFKVDFGESIIKGGILLEAAQFYSPVSFAGIDIGTNLVANNALFNNKDLALFTLMRAKFVSISGALFNGPVDFSMMNIDETFIICLPIPGKSSKNTMFKDNVSFTASSFGKNILAGQAQFEGSAIFDLLKVSENAGFMGATFHGPVSFLGTNIKGNFSLSEANFLSPEGMVGFNSIRVGGNGMFLSTQFRGPVDFSAAEIGGQLQFNGAKFLNKDHYIYFTGIRVEQMASFDMAIFKGSPLITEANFKENVSAKGTQFENSIISINFNYSRVGRTLDLQKAVFKGEVLFQRADVEGYFIANETRYLMRDRPVSFFSIKVGKDLLLKNAEFNGFADFQETYVTLNMNTEKATFKGGVTFLNADIRGDMFANETKYLGTDKTVSFNGIRVGKSIFLKKTKFEGPIDFIMAHIGWQLNAQEAMFLTKDKIIFNGIKVGDSVFMQGTEFNGPVNFGTAEITGNLEFNKAKFLDKKDKVEFFGLKVRRSVLLDDSEILGGVNFYGASIGMDLNSKGTKFLNEGSVLSFSNIKVGNEANFLGAIFRSDLLITYGNFVTLRIKGKVEGDTTIKSAINKISLYGTTVEKEFLIENADINILKANNFQSNGITVIEHVEIKELFDLTNSKFKVLGLLNVNIPKRRNTENKSIYMDNVTYEAIYAKTDLNSDDWRKLLDLLDNSQFNFQNYKYLANYYEKFGYTDRASEILKIGNKLYLDKMPFYERYPYELFWGKATGYGRNPLRTVGICFCFIVIGAFIFKIKYLDTSIIEKWSWLHKGKLRYLKCCCLSFFLSLDQFLPGKPLGLAEKWQIAEVNFGRLLYYKVHRFCGWLFISLALAATYAKFK